MVSPLRFGPLILLGSLAWAGEYYYLSYFLYTDRYRLVDDRIRASKAMVAPDRPKRTRLCELENPDRLPFDRLVARQSDAVVACLMRDRARVRSFETARQAALSREKVTLTFPPTLVEVRSLDDLVIIYRIQE